MIDSVMTGNGVKLEGEITLHGALVPDGHAVRVEGASVTFSRPSGLIDFFSGKLPEEVVTLLPRLYALCGWSHAIAFALACEAAEQREVASDVTQARQVIVGAESMRESLFAVLVDWPSLAGMAPEAREYGRLRATLDGAATSLAAGACISPGRPDPSVLRAAGAGLRTAAAQTLTERILGMSMASWSAMSDPGALASWANSHDAAAAVLVRSQWTKDVSLGASDVPLLSKAAIPAATSALVADIGNAVAKDPGYALKPVHQGNPAETGALARMHRHPLVAGLAGRFGRSVIARIAARLVELCTSCQGAWPAFGGVSTARGEGLGWVDTARGLLIHRVELERARVRRHAIVAPTEWNFHPAGVAPRGIEGRVFADADAARRALALVVHTLDPCVAWKSDLAGATK